MTDTDVADRRKALDAFAQAPTLPAAPSVSPMQSPADRVFGAQIVAVHRDETRILQRLATLGAAAGDDWFYRYPVKNRKENRTDWIEGPSIKLANDVARIYGNCDVDVRIFDLGDNWTIYARFTDFETGFSMTRPFQQRKGAGKIGGEGNDADARRLDIALQIGVSKAIRNVVVNALQTYADYAFDHARNSLVERIGQNLDGWRQRTIDGLGKIPVDVTRAERVIGRAAKDWLAPDVARIIAMMKAIADGMATADETFPPLDTKPETSGAQGANAEQQQHGSTQEQATTTAGASAADRPDPAQSSQQPPSQGSSAAASADAGSGKAAPADAKPEDGKAEAKNTQKDGKPQDLPPEEKPPTNEKEYIAYANKWRDEATDAGAAMTRWKEEKKLRNSPCNVSPDTRDDLLAKLQKKCGELQAAEG